MSYEPSHLPPTIGPYDQGMPAEPAEKPRSGLATGSLVVGLISLPANCVCVGPLLGLVAVVLGAISLFLSGSDPRRHGGRGKAIGGIVTGGVSMLTVIAMWQFAQPMMRFGAVVFDFQNIADAVQTYDSQNGTYPADLDTLASAGLFEVNPLGSDDRDVVSGVTYVTGLTKDDPADWILAHKETEVFGEPVFVVLYNPVGNGRNANPASSGPDDVPIGPYTELVEATQFAAKWEAFVKAYEEARGQPPVVIEPKKLAQSADDIGP